MRLYQRPNSPYWWLDVTINGQRHRVSTEQTAKREAQKSADRIIEQLSKAPNRSKEIWTVGESLTSWWEEHAKHTASADAIWSNIENLDRCLNCKVRVDRLTNALLMDFRAKRRGEPAWRSGKEDNPDSPFVSAQTVNRDLAYLQAALNHVATIHLQPVADIAWSKLKVREKEWRIRFLSADEYTALIDALHPAMRPMVVAAVTTGLRRGKLLAMQWHQVDLKGRTITIPTNKSGRPNIVRITAPLHEELEAMRKAQAIDPTTGEARIPTGKVFDTTNYKRRWYAAVKAAQLEDFKFHDLRHTFGSWARKAGADLLAIREAMDHSNIAMTMRYAHVDPDTEITAFDRAAATLRHTGRHTVKKKHAKTTH
ncbi:site-specific integrase [Sphingopyxis sp. SE2]|uniref:site-specific integrase n=1 Tax=Sphingopyxis sp. SE2 TaxID=1586240 RepID=UPI0028BFA338|nr:site-specific integrase [Sphingopyxis sp. SE2]MDT7531314.1 site-specific integrase [Sphingopyxis sp. SE2]